VSKTNKSQKTRGKRKTKKMAAEQEQNDSKTEYAIARYAAYVDGLKREGLVSAEGAEAAKRQSQSEHSRAKLKKLESDFQKAMAENLKAVNNLQ
jgi:hypothetical protein